MYKNNNYKSGAKSRISQLISGLSVLIFVVLFKPIVAYIPIPTVAGIVIYVDFKMFDLKEIKRNFCTTNFDAIVFVVTFLTTILIPRLDYAIYLGVVISVALVKKNTSDAKYSHISYDEKENYYIICRKVEDVQDDKLM